MKSANHVTLTMLILAAIAVSAAAYFYPWPELATADEEIGKPLFAEYEASDVRGIDIFRFNGERQTLDRIKLNRRKEEWIIPARQNYVATETRRIGQVINALNDRTVYEVISDNQEDHIKYGVLDPTEVADQKNIASLGTKFQLTNRSRQPIAELIVGLARKDDPTKRYVRLPGKPRVYTIDFDANLLTTEFALWVSPNALKLGQQSRQIRQITIQNYKLPAEKNNEKQFVYRANLVPGTQQLDVRSLEVPKEDGTWYPLKLTPEQIAKLTTSVRPLVLFFVDDVRKKSEEVIEAIFSQQDEDEELKKLATVGFINRGIADGRRVFDSVNGQIDVSTSDGVITTISIGRVGSANSKDTNKLNYYLMIHSAVDLNFLKKPVRPKGLKDDESDENKQFLKTLELWKSAVSRAERSAAELNAMHADWFYLISESIVETLRPEIPIPTIGKKPARNNGAENTSQSRDADKDKSSAQPTTDSSKNSGKKEENQERDSDDKA